MDAIIERNDNMTNTEKSLVFKALSHILANQEHIMKKLGEENFYLIEDTNTLAVDFGKMAKKYYKLDHPNWNDNDEIPE